MNNREMYQDMEHRVTEAGAPGTQQDPDKSHLLGILYTDDSGRNLTHPFFSLILNAFVLEAQERGYDILLLNPQSDGAYPEICRKRKVEGVGLICTQFDDPRVKELIDSKIPCVTIDHIFKGAPSIVSDNETGIQKLVEYAIAKGHKKIGFVYGQNNSIVTRTRISQFNNIMAYHNLPVPKEYIREGRYHDIRLVHRIVSDMLRLYDRPTCILLPDDVTYLGAQEAARELRLRIPEDISFAGYDGIPLTQTLIPPLTTIRQSSESMGQRAAQSLISLIENPESAWRKPYIFPVELIEGGTVG